MDILFGFLLRALSRFVRSRFPSLAETIGLGDELFENLSSKPADLVGQTGRVEVAIEGGRGRVVIGGISGSAEGEDLPLGHAVRVARVDGNRLTIERA